MENTLSGIDSVVIFKNSQSKQNRGTLVHITRSTIIFEVYNPYSVVQLSEVLQDLVVMRGERTIYNGKAVVSSLVNTGIMAIISATLVDTWSDLDGLKSEESILDETRRFVSDWEKSHQLQSEYQLTVSSLSSFLSELNTWLEEAEATLQENLSEDQEKQMAFTRKVGAPVTDQLARLFDNFEAAARKIPEEENTTHKAFARRELHPLLLCAPFVHRSYTKPLGYAGDYEMVNMMLHESPSVGNSVYSQIIHALYVATPSPESHRNRIDMLQDRLKGEAQRVLEEEERTVRILNVGCGPAVEIQRFLRDQDISDHISLTLMDFSEETLDYTRQKVEKIITEKNRKTRLKIVHKSIDVLLKEVHQQGEDEVAIAGTYDLVYCAGLFDYFPQHVCKYLVELYFKWVAPGGLLSVTNVHPANPYRYSMEHILEWYLIYRDEEMMRDLAPPGSDYAIDVDATGLNLHLDVRKP